MFILGKDKLFSAFMFWGHVSLKLKRMKFYSSLSYHFYPPPIISGSSRLRGNYESEESAYYEHTKNSHFHLHGFERENVEQRRVFNENVTFTRMPQYQQHITVKMCDKDEINKKSQNN